MGDKKWRQLKWNWTYCAYAVRIHSNYPICRNTFPYAVHGFIYYARRDTPHASLASQWRIVHRRELSLPNLIKSVFLFRWAYKRSTRNYTCAMFSKSHPINSQNNMFQRWGDRVSAAAMAYENQRVLNNKMCHIKSHTRALPSPTTTHTHPRGSLMAVLTSDSPRRFAQRALSKHQAQHTHTNLIYL